MRRTGYLGTFVTILLFSAVTMTHAATTFSLTSPTVSNGAPIAASHYWNQFGCSGANERPELNWSGAPEGTKSFAITFYDHDAPTGSGFWHWVAYNIPADVTKIKADTLPAGTVEGNTDLAKPGFFGPCPPVGRKHQYTFTLHALDVEKLPAPEGASAALTGFFIYQHTIGRAQLNTTAGPRSQKVQRLSIIGQSGTSR